MKPSRSGRSLAPMRCSYPWLEDELLRRQEDRLDRGGWPFVKEVEEGVLVSVRLQPGAARSELAGVQGDELKLRVAAPPVEGRANEAARFFLAELLGVPKSSVALVRGAASRSKRFLIRGATVQGVVERLSSRLGH